MTQRLTIGIDPGLFGAVAALADGVAREVHDMPVRKVGEWGEVDAVRLASLLRGIRGAHPGAYVSACIERVGAAPVKGVRQGGTSLFRFGETYGRICGVLESLGIPYSRAIPAVWKRRFGLLKTDKTAARELAASRFPGMADQLKRKKDDGRAEALLVALWHEDTQIGGLDAA